MLAIFNDNDLRAFCENITYKETPALKEPELLKQFFEFVQANQDLVSKSSAYEIASLIRSYAFWYSKKDVKPKAFFVNPGEVYYVDLGAFNLKYEESFMHSCVIIKRFGTSVLVVPGSSKKYGRKNFLIESVDAGNGFKDNTGVLIDQLRCVSVTRIRGKMIGKLAPETFEIINMKIMEAFMNSQYKELIDLRNKNDILKKDLEQHLKKIADLEEQVKNNQGKTEK